MRHTAQRRAGAHEHGFTLIELVVAMVCLAAMSFAVIGVIMSTQTQAANNRNRIAASNLAAREIDRVREQFAATDSGPVDLANEGLAVNPHPLVGGTAGQPLVVDGVPYTVTRNSEWNVTGTGASACEGGSLVAYPSLGVSVSVTWPSMGSIKPVVSNASFAPDKDTGVATTDSFIAAKVVNQAGAPLANIPVNAGTTAYTDSTGCAIIRVSPAVGGTTYTVRVADASYVDISGTVNPAKSTGPLQRGRIYSGASFAIGKAGSVTLTLVRADGQPLNAAQVAGSTVTLVATAYSGSTGQTQRTVTGVTTTFTGLYPTSYGAFFGTTAPGSGYSVTQLNPGGTLSLNVAFEMAHVSIANLPAGSTRVVAVPAGTATTCAAGDGTSGTVAGTGSDFDLLPGNYDLYVVGNTFGCSPGPTGVAYISGDNVDTNWGTTTLRVLSAPGGTLWAVDKNLSGITSLTTCPTGVTAIALNIDGARTAPIAVPAGDWYVWQAAANGSGCTSYPDAMNPFSMPYNAATTKTWSLNPATLKVTGLNKSVYIVVSSTAVTGCTATTVNPTPSIAVSAVTTTSSATVILSAPKPVTGTTTYYAYIWDKADSATNKCKSLGTYIVGPGTTTLSKTNSSTGAVGP